MFNKENKSLSIIVKLKMKKLLIFWAGICHATHLAKPKSCPWVLFRHIIIKATFFQIFYRDTCSWKGQLKRTRSWTVLSWKVRSWKVSLKLERAKRSWKEPSDMKLSNFQRNFLTSLGSFQLRWVLFNFARFFPTSLGSFQFRWVLSNLKLFNFSFFPTALSNYTHPIL